MVYKHLPLRAQDNRTFGVALVSFGLLVLFVSSILQTYNWNPKIFLFEGTRFSQLDPNGTTGYDGQFVYYIARDPLNAAVHLDLPAHRYQRIVYPTLAWVLSFGGNTVLLPWVMLFINMLAASVAAGFLAQLLVYQDVSPWYALLWIIYAGLLYSVRADLNEPVALALALAGWLAYERSRFKTAVALFAVAGLAKEIGLLFPAGLLLWELVNRNWRQAVGLAVGSIGPYLIMTMILQVTFGSTAAVTTPILIPFWGFRYLTDPGSRVMVAIWVIFPAVASGLWALLDIAKHRSKFMVQGQVIFLVLVHVILIATMPRLTWEHSPAVLRTALGLVAVILVWLAAYHPRVLRYTIVLWLPSALLMLVEPAIIGLGLNLM